MLKRQFLSLSLIALGWAYGGAIAQTAVQTPDALVKQVSTEVLESIKADKAIQAGDTKRILALVDAKILPHVDFDAMTEFAAGKAAWGQATPDQRKRLQDEFKVMLVRQYAAAFAQVRDQSIEFGRVLKSPDNPGEVIVRTKIVGQRDPVPINYYLQRVGDEWKIFDLDVLGIRLGLSYQSQWGPVIKAKGLDGLIAELAQRNKSAAAKG
ncbi:MlaC/ttg2D family ABC transporter substrate-binding protein [Methylibium sp.]|uniref:MlaC/ttg2D family ABC transporter substrate-binding protein n=1 Tax=Methylibium sp. TaxID=2067992 RepID=UPI003D115027